MKIKSHLKFESSIVTSALFVAGIFTSIGAMYEHGTDPSKVTMFQISANVGLTFLLGLFSIHFTARSVRQTVVYLAHKKENETATEVVSDEEHQLNTQSINEILAEKKDISQKLVNELSHQLNAGQAGLYVIDNTTVKLKLGFALNTGDPERYCCTTGEGLVGRVALEGNSLYVDKLPEEYITIHSGLGSASPNYLVIVPLKTQGKVRGVLEIALFKPLTSSTINKLENIGQSWAEAGL